MKNLCVTYDSNLLHYFITLHKQVVQGKGSKLVELTGTAMINDTENVISWIAANMKKYRYELTFLSGQEEQITINMQLLASASDDTTQVMVNNMSLTTRVILKNEWN